ncbi:Transposable element P transposase [Orchesella cincta]|uniref:Transposable element P transposase n=1 Tax=Orchesella cincta TaxID=48709 RepID=A0A1D2N730_ORCCI|nr:Transposable element P transposase [Orchesella cincta]
MAISFEKMTKKFKGYIDYAEFSEYAKERKSPKCEADHCLVFLIPFFLNSKITQPIACFATRGAAPGNILAKMLLVSCLMEAATNKSMWRELGITTKRGSGIVNSITNPVDEGRQVFFSAIFLTFLNVLEITSTIRKTSRFKDSTQTYTKRHCSRPIQKMSVASAAHVFSKSTANGLKAYREISQNSFFQKSEPTENFTRLLNDLFDACNGRIPMDGLRPENAKYKIIEDFLAAMSPSDTYASDQTFVSLQVTLTSLLELTHYLCNVIGYHYVLAGKCNQDPLEKFFGLVRSFGGNDCHPTATSFSHIFRLLSVYFPTSRSIKGNVSKDEEYAVVSVSCIDTLKCLRNVAKTEQERNNKLLEDTILSKIFYSQDQL